MLTAPEMTPVIDFESALREDPAALDSVRNRRWHQALAPRHWLGPPGWVQNLP